MQVDHFHVYSQFGGFWARLWLGVKFAFTSNISLAPGATVKYCLEPHPCGR